MATRRSTIAQRAPRAVRLPVPRRGEANSGLFGGADPGDNSGVLNYVVVKYAGSNVDPENQLNGIAFQGGAGTRVDYIQVHNNLDDGIEMFGGTVNLKHVVLSGNADDSLDWTDGWIGNVQFLQIVQAATPVTTVSKRTTARVTKMPSPLQPDYRQYDHSR